MKKLLSLILATLLVVSLLPASFASAEVAANPTKLVYTFNQASHGLDAGTSYSALDFTIEGTVSGARWGFDGMNNTKAFPNLGSYQVHKSTKTIYTVIPYDTSSGSNEFWTYKADLLEGNAANYPLVMILLEVPTAGTYVPTLEFGYKGENQYNFELGLIKETATTKAMGVRAILQDYMSEGRFGTHDLQAAYKSTNSAVKLEKGNYYLVIAPNGGGAGAVADGQSQTWIKSFTLTPLASEMKPNVYQYNFGTSSLNIGNVNEETGEVDLGGNTWTDPEAEKFIPWSETVDNSTAGVGKNNPAENMWGIYTKYAYFGTANAAYKPNAVNAQFFNKSTGGTFIVPNYDYIIESRSAKWVPNQFFWKMRTSYIAKDHAYFIVDGTVNSAKKPYTTFELYVPEAGNYIVETKLAGARQLKHNYYIFKSNEDNDGNLQINGDPSKGEIGLSTSINTSYPDTSSDRFRGVVMFGGTINDTTAVDATKYLIGSFDPSEGTTKVISQSYNFPKAGNYTFVVEFDDSHTDNPGTVSNLESGLAYLKLTQIVEKSAEEIASEPLTAAKETIKNVNPENPTPSTNAEGTSATVNVLATDFDEATLGTVIDAQAKTAGDKVTVEAPEIGGYRFRYWAKGFGAKRVAVSEEDTYTFTAARGANYVYAVYTKTGTPEKTIVEFYNANRQLVSRKEYAVGAEIVAPALPDTTFGEAKAWVDAEGEAFVAGTVAETAIMVYVAEYDETSDKTVTITANGTEGITGAGEVAYGTDVTLEAPNRENKTGFKVFAYWEDAEAGIISFDRKYKFAAVADRTLTAVYADYAPIKRDITKIVAVKNGDIITAEFVGCGDALERGFSFSSGAKAVMTTGAKTFTMILDDNEVTARAYAIFEDGILYADFE
ncbi:MAG: hypothetical protein IKU65_04785 [Oscillospiraceae bacterium]|nr:hypothetical protein [Oscillospiraceae bacterium]